MIQTVLDPVLHLRKNKKSENADILSKKWKVRKISAVFQWFKVHFP
jgi:hypothetical protein